MNISAKSADVSRSSEDRGERRDSKEKESEQKEGPVARAIEEKKAKLPSDLFLWGATGSILASAVLEVVTMRRHRLLAGNRSAQLSLFIGQWAPTFLLLGLYNKLVKVAGSDRATRAS